MVFQLFILHSVFSPSLEKKFFSCYSRSQLLKLRLNVDFTLKFFCHFFYCSSCNYSSSRRLWNTFNELDHYNLSFFSFVLVLRVRKKLIHIFSNISNSLLITSISLWSTIIRSLSTNIIIWNTSSSRDGLRTGRSSPACRAGQTCEEKCSRSQSFCRFFSRSHGTRKSSGQIGTQYLLRLYIKRLITTRLASRDRDPYNVREQSPIPV